MVTKCKNWVFYIFDRKSSCRERLREVIISRVCCIETVLKTVSHHSASWWQNLRIEYIAIFYFDFVLGLSSSKCREIKSRMGILYTVLYIVLLLPEIWQRWQHQAFSSFWIYSCQLKVTRSVLHHLESNFMTSYYTEKKKNNLQLAWLKFEAKTQLYLHCQHSSNQKIW